MRVTLLYFAAIRDLVGLDREELELEEVGTVAALRAWLEAHRPALAGRLGPVRIAVDESFVDDTHALAAGAVIALIPPVAGG